MRFKALTEQREWDWVWSRAKPTRMPDSQGVVAYDEEDNILAICVADSFTLDACCVHLAIDNPLVLRHGFMHEVAFHLFNSCLLKRVFGSIPSNNKRAIKFAAHVGLKEVARIPDGYAEGVDYIVVRMDRQDCRWLPKEEAAA